MILLPKVFTHALRERQSNFLTQKWAHNSWRDVKFPMPSGMGPVNRLLKRSLHPYTHTRRGGFSVKLNVHCMSYALLLFFFLLIPHSSTREEWDIQWLHWDKGTHITKKGCQIPDAFRNVASKFPHTEVCAPKICSMPLICFLSFTCENLVSKHPWIFFKGV